MDNDSTPETPYPHLPGEVPDLGGDDRVYAAVQLDRAKVFTLDRKYLHALDAIARAVDALERLRCELMRGTRPGPHSR